MQRTRGDIVDVRVDHVVTLNPLEHLGVDVHLAVGAILFTAGVHAEEAELAEGEPHAESGEYSYGQEKDKSLNESRHTHHRGDPRGTGHSLYRRNHSARGVRNAPSNWSAEKLGWIGLWVEHFSGASRRLFATNDQCDEPVGPWWRRAGSNCRPWGYEFYVTPEPSSYLQQFPRKSAPRFWIPLKRFGTI